MKKIFLFSIIFNIAFANVNYKLYEKYVDDMLNYSLPFNYSFYNPFNYPFNYSFNNNTNNQKSDKKKLKKDIIKKEIANIKTGFQLKSLAILNNKVLVFLNRKGKKWLKVGDNFEGYKLIKIMKSSVLFKYKNKLKIVPTQDKTNKLKLKVSK